MNGVDEIFESGLNSNRCTGKLSCFAAALVKQWATILSLTHMWRQLHQCAMTAGRQQTAYMSHRDKVGAATGGHVQTSKSLVSGDVLWKANILKPANAVSFLGMLKNIGQKPYSRLRGTFVSNIQFGGYLRNAH